MAKTQFHCPGPNNLIAICPNVRPLSKHMPMFIFFLKKCTLKRISISAFVNNLNYQVIWNQAHINQNIQEIDYTYSNTINGITHCSTIDHFISNETFYNSITEAGKVQCPYNTSNHHPIFCKFNVDNLNRSFIVRYLLQNRVGEKQMKLKKVSLKTI